MRLFAISMVMLAASVAAAQSASVPVVTASGSATLQKQPTELRVSVELTGSGKDMTEALGKLAKSRADAKAKLEGLKPVDGSVVVAETTVGEGGGMNMRERQMRMVMSRRSPQQEKPAAVTVNASIKATFALPEGTGDEAIARAHELEQKIKTTLVPGDAAKKVLTAEEQEMMEEMAAMGQSVAKPGEPSFTYVAVISPEQATKLTADAIAKAKAQAAIVAAAAGGTLGGIHQIQAHAGAIESYSDYQQAVSGTTQLLEATGTGPGAVSYTVSVNVEFELGKK